MGVSKQVKLKVQAQQVELGKHVKVKVQVQKVEVQVHFKMGEVKTRWRLRPCWL